MISILMNDLYKQKTEKRGKFPRYSHNLGYEKEIKQKEMKQINPFPMENFHFSNINKFRV